MPSPTEITAAQLSRLVGLPGTPALIDVRPAEAFAADPRLLPTAWHRDFSAVAAWGASHAGRPVIVYCRDGGDISQGTAAWLRQAGIDAQSIEGGFDAWRDARLTLMRTEKLPARDDTGRTVWVTRARPKIARIACPWLIRRFIDPAASFLFVGPSEVMAVADRFNATPFDLDGVFWSDRGERCTFDVMVEEFGLETQPLSRLALIVRGADTGRLDLAPQCAGLLAASLGYSRMYRDDLAQLAAAMALYDAFYRWCRDASDETHGQARDDPSPSRRGGARPTVPKPRHGGAP
ncbi:MAG: chromate resistance protein [Proteobacteria bacterium]|nr:chromate resistance protein [Pseudomonadota bacterium]